MSCSTDSSLLAGPERGPECYTVPIVGYEIVERRERYTVYKIRVQKQGRTWFIFRRYSDFERLFEKLSFSFPRVELKLPPKRWFGDNFNPEFIAKRAQGLQNFIKSILQHQDLHICRETREFFCLDEPPGPFDSLEESRAYVQYLEEQMEDTKTLMKEVKGQLEATKSQLSKARSRIHSLENTLQRERLQRKSPELLSHSTPAAGDVISCEPMDVPLSDLSGSSIPKSKSGKSVSFARSKAASEGNLLQLKKKEKRGFPSLKNQTDFRHSITFGEDFFVYNGFLDVEFHSNVTNKMKERKKRTRKEKGKTQDTETPKGENPRDGSWVRHKGHKKQDKGNVSRTIPAKESRKKEKRDSGIIGDGFTDSDF